MATLEMTRRFAAPPVTVFEILTSQTTLLEWWGPEGTAIGENNLDFSKPGAWHAEMIGPSGDGAVVRGIVQAVDPPNSVTFTLCFDMGPAGLGPESVVNFTLHPDDRSGTVLTLTQSGLDPAHIEDMRTKGWNSALGRLEILVNNA